MIFCFSGTGNSLHVAEKIAEQTKDQITMITESELQQNKVYEIRDEERLGFVFPIYWWGMPKEVERFVENMHLKSKQLSYAYAVCTFGLVGNNGMADLKKLLMQKEIELDAIFEVKMVDNYIVGYELADDKKKKEILTEAEEKIEDILPVIEKCHKQKIIDRKQCIKPLVHHFYKTKDHRKKFYVTNNCIGCRKCERECPSAAIQMNGDRPEWINDCSFCLKCIHDCPKEAVQYGKTEGRKRYHFREL